MRLLKKVFSRWKEVWNNEVMCLWKLIVVFIYFSKKRLLIKNYALFCFLFAFNCLWQAKYVVITVMNDSAIEKKHQIEAFSPSDAPWKKHAIAGPVRKRTILSILCPRRKGARNIKTKWIEIPGKTYDGWRILNVHLRW